VSVTLPYHFDTSSPGTFLIAGAAGLLGVVVVGLLYTALVSHQAAAALALAIVGALTIYFGRLFLINFPASRGRITADAVTVEAARVFGLRLAGPEGTFPIGHFKGVLVAHLPPPVGAYGVQHERVSLIGRDGTPEILVARTRLGEGRAFGRELGALLRLPVEEASLPY